MLVSNWTSHGSSMPRFLMDSNQLEGSCKAKRRDEEKLKQQQQKRFPRKLRVFNIEVSGTGNKCRYFWIHKSVYLHIAYENVNMYRFTGA